MSLILQKFRVLRNMLTRRPILTIFDVTKLCNQRCPMCNIWKTESHDMSLAEIENKACELQKFGIGYVFLQGGDPLVRKDIKEIIDIFLKHGIHPTVITNGILLTPEIAEFIASRPSDRIGIVVFAGESFTQSPLTSDRVTLINLMKEIETGLIEDGTAIGNGLATAVARLKDSDGKSKVVILLTDGVNNRGEITPAMAAEIASTYGIRVYTIGVGAMGTAPYPVMTPWGVQLQQIPVEIDEPLLKDIASQTGGKYFRATDNKKLLEIYGEINRMEKNRTTVESFPVYSEKFMDFALIALIALLLELVFRFFVLRRLT